ncbi:leucine-rich repeat extensin-like protein 4 [Camellia sinensis]|uniref:leucine-rich repeat extensin-like protein 4 n=1 Tax=Camellia sinensis TaxID=4442 RepID=UPI0010355E59|nr:leucine-rich repeat extensin-like protein 4 [Camellia sinensis]
MTNIPIHFRSRFYSFLFAEEIKTATSTHHFFSHILSLHFFLFSLLFFMSSATSHYDFAINGVLIDSEALYIKQRQLLYYRDEFGDRGEFVTVNPSLVFPNPRLRTAYIALKAWKEAIFSDPQNLTTDWVGTPPEFLLSSAEQLIDLHRCRHRSQPRRHRRVLPEGARTPHRSRIVAHQLESILRHRPSQVQELEASLRARSQQQQFAGKFLRVFLKLPSLKFLDLRFNKFEGNVPILVFIFLLLTTLW